MGKGIKRFLLLFCAGILALTMAGCTTGSAQTPPADEAEETVNLFAMDTYMQITAYGSQSTDALRAAEARIQDLEGLWSVTERASDIYALNHGSGSPVEVDPSTNEIIQFALDMAARTDGALEPTIYPVLTAWGFTTGDHQIPEPRDLEVLLDAVGYDRVLVEGDRVTIPDVAQIDLGAVAKGYTADIITAILKEHGIRSALIDLGGNIQVVGAKPDGSKWRVGIKDAFGGDTVGVLEVVDRAVVTSGGYERYFIGDDGELYGHIIDPATGRPADNGLVSVTVIGTQGSLCDALSTALFVMGLDDASDHWRESDDFEMILMTGEQELYLTEGLEDDFSLSQSHEGMTIHILRK